jgi:hypothetical protein
MKTLKRGAALRSAAETVPELVISDDSADAALDQVQMLLAGVERVKSGRDQRGMNARKLTAANGERLLRNPKVGRVGKPTIADKHFSSYPKRGCVWAGDRASAGAGDVMFCKLRCEGTSALEACSIRTGM